MPECIRCGATSRLFEIESGVFACKWQAGCDHRAMQQEARIANLIEEMRVVDIERRITTLFPRRN